MKLSRSSLKEINAKQITIPSPAIFELPERVLQFGTGVLLRGLPDYFIDKANRQGKFNGRIVVVKSTDGPTDEFDQQDSLYTLCIRGIEDGKKIEQTIVSSAISRVLQARDHWSDVLAFAASESLDIIISNTTEVGIQLTDDDVNANPPVSYPGKLLAVLYHRYRTFKGAADKGLVIIPTELILDNGTKLKEIVLKLAENNKLPGEFVSWLQEHNHFCNSLVDRIVPGKPSAEMQGELAETLGYTDRLLSMSEVYRLWAIEGDEEVKERLSFASVDPGVIITPNIELYRELKLRLLNGTHTLSCGIAFLAGLQTVKLGMEDKAMENYISEVMKLEIAPAIPYAISKEVAEDFSNKVLDRFRNPFIQHQWISITLNYTSKLAMRVVPVLVNYVEKFNTAPSLIALGFAAYICFMKGTEKDGKYYGMLDGKPYFLNDDRAGHLAALWEGNGPGNIVAAVLADQSLWGTDLSVLPGFTDEVSGYFAQINNFSMRQVLDEVK